MRTVTLDILNDEAIKLLKNLEVLNLVRFRKDKETPSSNTDMGQVSLSDFSFSKSRKILKNYAGSLSDATTEERRSEI